MAIINRAKFFIGTAKTKYRNWREFNRLPKSERKAIKQMQKDMDRNVPTKVEDYPGFKTITQIKKEAAAITVVATQSPEAKKIMPSEYVHPDVNLKKSILGMLQKLPYSLPRNRLIRDVELMDNARLNQLYREKPELFEIYWDFDSDALYNQDVYEDSEEGLYGYQDLVTEYERRWGTIV